MVKADVGIILTPEPRINRTMSRETGKSAREEEKVVVKDAEIMVGEKWR